jgi:hypothetical protein
VIVSAVGATTIEVEAVAVCTGLLESVTETAKLDVAIAEGVPEMMPVAGAMESPVGNWPVEIDHVYGAVPPVKFNEPLYTWATVAPGRGVEPMVSFGAAITKVKVEFVVCCGDPLSFTVTPKVKVPVTVGVPEITPLDADRDNPAGSWPELIEEANGAVPPVALTLALYEMPMVPEESEVVDIANVGAVLPGDAIITGTT